MEIVKVTLPIDEDLLIRSFTEDITFEVSVKESSLKNQDLLFPEYNSSPPGIKQRLASWEILLRR